MMADFNDIRIVGLDEERTIQADPGQPLYDVHFVLSAEAPAAWGWIAQSHLGRKGIAGRKAWPQTKYLVVRCKIEEIERVLNALRPSLEAINKEYRDWSAATERTRLEQEAFDRKEAQKLRDVKVRLGLA